MSFKIIYTQSIMGQIKDGRQLHLCDIGTETGLGLEWLYMK
jgi:hypothetical protein